MADSATSSHGHSAPPHQHSHDPAIAMIQLASAASEQYGKGPPDRSRDLPSFAEADAAFAGSSAYPATAPNMNGAPGVVPGGGAPLLHHHPINENDMNNVVQGMNNYIQCPTPNEASGGASMTSENGMYYEDYGSPGDMSGSNKKKRKSAGAAKQHQLPMFLTKTYHMIEKCDQEIATWSENGDNFVVKNVEKFASSVLPQYFKHSNFSSFARQLNFYGFRKLKAEPILTADYDARTANYVRFYHEKFQKDKPELLVHIKRATKSDVQSKDDVESMRAEIQHLNDVIAGMQNEFDKRLYDMNMDLNMKIQSVFNMVNQMRGGAPPPPSFTAPVVAPAVRPKKETDMMRMLSQASMTLQSPAVQAKEPINHKVDDTFTLT